VIDAFRFVLAKDDVVHILLSFVVYSIVARGRSAFSWENNTLGGLFISASS
jgi:hypothetical protein